MILSKFGFSTKPAGVCTISRNLDNKDIRRYIFLWHSTIVIFENCRFIYFHSLIKSAFLPCKGLFRLYDRQNNIWLLVDMEFLFSCSTRHLALTENYDHCCFFNHDSMHFSILLSANALYDCSSEIVDSFIVIHQWSRLFFSVKGYCVYTINKIITKWV